MLNPQSIHGHHRRRLVVFLMVVGTLQDGEGLGVNVICVPADPCWNMMLLHRFESIDRV